ncbi:hypothetical protein CPC735_028160 [Coccidioides posadasii C735 delta SOWgp]|uniref:Uncharacterized protein n=1 Tax=Coccidioides posadasii (strain C735) TaxID=222929 RepID=C5P7T0_COCP7|nr:hypothetical protein CPC735_028160 [Coccidioides posadasii C735 delta SOWgp]EER27480.1 hypothetical protein CPC735_028160 [Coccidioides posadasii C735 delta SOWgp]|eukprot:XP_003069625.1 hypothetical protein CPC735_028160 [Coccidioides posadasii C735 delta SOWgp]
MTGENRTMEVRKIPGFYYDPDKKRYFKLQENYQVPQGSRYSRGEVSKREESVAKRKKVESFEERLASERITPSRILHHPLFGNLGLQREIGQHGPRANASIRDRSKACVGLLGRDTLVDVRSWNAGLTVKNVERDPRTARLFTMLSLLDLQNIHGDTTLQTTAMILWGGVMTMALSHNLMGLSVNLTIGKLLTTNDPDFRRGETFDGPLVCVSRPGWSNCNIAPSPDTATTTFTVGCGMDLITVSNNESQWILATAKKFKSPIRSVDWLSRNVIIAGATSSKVWLYDVRSQGSVARLQHAHGVQSLRKLDDWRIVVAGANLTLSMYDLRFASHRTDDRPRPNNPSHKATTPYLNFYDVQCNIFNNIDVCPELGLLACSSEQRTVQLYSLATGKRLTTDRDSKPTRAIRHSLLGYNFPENLASYQYPGPISLVKFDNLPDRLDLLKDYEDDERDFSKGGRAGIPSLLVASGSAVDEWHLANEQG